MRSPSDRWRTVRTNEPSEPFELEADGLEIVTPDALWSVGYEDGGGDSLYVWASSTVCCGGARFIEAASEPPAR